MCEACYLSQRCTKPILPEHGSDVYLPGIVGLIGRPPHAIKICFAPIFSPLTSTQPSSVNFA